MSAKYCTRRISAEKNEFSVTPASSSTLVENPRCRAAASRYTIATAARAPAKLAAGTAAQLAAARAPPTVRTSIAPSAAPADMPSVKGVASGLRNSAWNTTPDDAKRAADQRRGEHARQARDEEDLRVDVCFPGPAEIERAAERDRRAAGQRCQQHRAERERRRPEPGGHDPPRIPWSLRARSTGRRRRSAVGSTALMGRFLQWHHSEMTGFGMKAHVRAHAVQALDVRCRSARLPSGRWR